MARKRKLLKSNSVSIRLDDSQLESVYPYQESAHRWRTSASFDMGNHLIGITLTPKLTQMLACHFVGATRRLIEEGALDESDHLVLTTRSE